MKTWMIIAICIVVILYIQLAVGFGYYMFALTYKRIKEEDKKNKQQIVRYSIIAGVAFPVTFAIIIANRIVERR